ncbi:MAG: PqqD family protein [Candidatus Odinarchaeota archaeon]|nr:PqqD family protein [Candidatus Odinarchaeota archaeon]
MSEIEIDDKVKASQSIYSLDSKELMRVKPVRNPAIDWKTGDQNLVVITVKKKEKPVEKIVGKIFPIPKIKRIRLDEVGSFVWRLCNGETTIKSIVDKLIKEYKLTQREAYVSLLSYLRTLSSRNLIYFVMPHKKKK